MQENRSTQKGHPLSWETRTIIKERKAGKIGEDLRSSALYKKDKPKNNIGERTHSKDQFNMDPYFFICSEKKGEDTMDSFSNFLPRFSLLAP